MNLTTLMDTPRLYTALAEWGACLVYIFLLRRKMSGLKLSFFLGGSLIVFVAYHEFAGTLPIYFWIPCMIGAAFCIFSVIQPGWMHGSVVQKHWSLRNLQLRFTGSSMSGGR